MAGANSANGTVVQLYTCNGSAAQSWTVGTDGSLKVLGNKCLDVRGNTSTDGTPLQVWTCFAGANQRWTILSQPVHDPPGPTILAVIMQKVGSGFLHDHSWIRLNRWGFLTTGISDDQPGEGAARQS